MANIIDTASFIAFGDFPPGFPLWPDGHINAVPSDGGVVSDANLPGEIVSHSGDGAGNMLPLAGEGVPPNPPPHAGGPASIATTESGAPGPFPPGVPAEAEADVPHCCPGGGQSGTSAASSESEEGLLADICAIGEPVEQRFAGSVPAGQNPNISTWPPGVPFDPEIPGASPVVPDHRPFVSPASILKRWVRIADCTRVTAGAVLSPSAGVATGFAAKATLIAAGAVHTAAAAPLILPVAAAAGVAVGIATAIPFVLGPLRRFVRAQVRDMLRSAGGGLVDTDYTDPGFTVRDAADDESPDQAPEGTLYVAGTGAKVGRKRRKHFAPYAGGQVRGAYLCSIVAEVRTQFAGRNRDVACEHAARRALVTKMVDHGMRPTDIDRVREHCLNAVFYISEEEEAAEQVRALSEWAKLSRPKESKA